MIRPVGKVRGLSIVRGNLVKAGMREGTENRGQSDYQLWSRTNEGDGGIIWNVRMDWDNPWGAGACSSSVW